MKRAARSNRVHAAADRTGAAALLRAARASGSDDGGESIGWAFAILPESTGARRLKIELLIRQGNHEAADVLIAKALLRRPTSASLTYLRAMSLSNQGRYAQADRELRLVLAERPHHHASLLLSGSAAIHCGDAARAAELLERAEQRRPTDDTRSLLADAWILAGRPDRARAVLQRMARCPVLLSARLLSAEGRLLEAIELLDGARRDGDAGEYAPVMCALVDLLEETSDLKHLVAILEPVGTAHPEVLERAGRAWLAMGAFRTAIVRMARLARLPRYRSRALVTMLVASSMLDRRALAARTLDRLRRADGAVDRAAIADAWCRGLRGRLILDEQGTRTAGADPHTGQLQELVAEAANSLDAALKSGVDDPCGTDRQEIQDHLATCRQVAAYFDGVDPFVRTA